MKMSGEKTRHDWISSRKFFPTPKKGVAKLSNLQAIVNLTSKKVVQSRDGKMEPLIKIILLLIFSKLLIIETKAFDKSFKITFTLLHLKLL